ncbi:hypothetical protein CHU98_g4245 [Xylaria longipes]|nr:hypothetical protein CHU98_g4245 [Xylaria longipes]
MCRLLRAIARETKAALAGILRQLPRIEAHSSEKLTADDLPVLGPANCPGFALSSDPKLRGTHVKVFSEDPFNAAISMAESLSELATTQPEHNQRVVAINLASDKKPGGVWLRGAMAQEEAFCYRSSLALSLHKSYYPWTIPTMGLHTRDVVIVRSSMSAGHALLVPETPATQLPPVSISSVAAIRRPAVRKVFENGQYRQSIFKFPADRDLTKNKMRLALRIAARQKHELLVVGAMGCGAFRNPPKEITHCWSEVLGEVEF